MLYARPRIWLLAATLWITVSCQRQDARVLTVLAAPSVAADLSPLVARFEREHPRTQVRTEWVGSLLACRQVQQQDRAADVLIVADAELITAVLSPSLVTSHAAWRTDALVLAYPAGGRVAEHLAGGKPWQVALTDARIGYANPATAPLGYRTLMALSLNDRSAVDELRLGARIRANLRARDERSDASQVAALVETGAVDAAFLYRHEAKQRGFAVQELDPAINFGDLARAAWYASESLTLPQGAGRVAGSAVRYSVATLAHASNPHLAGAFAAFVLAAGSSPED